MTFGSKVMLGFGAGILAGLLLGDRAVYLKPFGDLFLNALKMLIVPLIFASLVVAIGQFKDPRRLGRVGLKTFGLVAFFSSVAISTGLGIGHLLQPGAALDLNVGTMAPSVPATTLVDQLVGIIPSNPIAALSSGNTLQIVAFALIFGVAMLLAGDSAKPMVSFFDALLAVMSRFTAMILTTLPYGVFALIATTVGAQGVGIFLPLARLILAVILGCGIHALLFYSVVLLVMARYNPWRFFSRMGNVVMMASTTTSTAATLPVSLPVVQRDLGVSSMVAKFVLSIGVTVNKGGTVLYQSVSVMFIAQAYGISLSGTQLLMVGVVTLVSSFGTPSIPGAGLIMLTLILNSAGLPVEGLAVIAGVDRLLDMMRTPVNALGDCVVALVIEKSESQRLTS